MVGQSPAPGANEPAITAVVFDLGGVLIDWNPRHLYRTLFEDDVDGMESFLSTVCTVDWHYQHDLGRPMRETCAELATAHPEQADLIWAWRDRAGDMVRGQIEGSVEVLRQLSARGVPCYALSNWPSETFWVCRDRFDFLGLFAGVVISGQEGVAKPDPAIFLRLLDRFGLSPASTLVVDDYPAHVATAGRLGMKTVLFEEPAQLRRRLVALGLLPPHGPGDGVSPGAGLGSEAG